MTAVHPMDADRELDVAVAERVLGWTRDGQPADVDHQFAGEPVLMRPGQTFKSLAGNGYYPPPRGRLPLTFFVPHFSDDFNAAQEIIGHLRATHCVELAFLRHDVACDIYTPELAPASQFSFGPPRVCARAATPARAICLAALSYAERVLGR